MSCEDFPNNLEKPHSSVFTYASSRIGYGPEECIFFDDNLSNLVSAKVSQGSEL